MYHKNDKLMTIAHAIKAAGGRALIVGGYVRDHILGLNPKDIDIEVYGLEIDILKGVLSKFDDVDMVGKAFGVFKLHGCDISVPRRDNKVAPGHKGFEVSFDPFMSIPDAARRRDFTMNSMSLDPLTGEILDPFNGRLDLERKALVMTDPKTFVEDPLRVLRAAQFISRFELAPDDSLLNTSREIAHTMRELPGERVWEEMVKLLLKGNKPSQGFEFLKNVGVLPVLFPELQALIGCPQEPEWHPEGWSVIPLDSLITSMTQSGRSDNLPTRKVDLKPKAANAFIEGSDPASCTPSVEDRIVDGLSPANLAGPFDIFASSSLGITSFAKPQSFIRTFGTPAIGAPKVFRIMFKIPLNGMFPVVGPTIDNLKIVREVIGPVAIYVMNVFGPLNFASKLEFHDNPMEARGPVDTWPTGVYVTVIEVNTASTSVDNNVVYTVECIVQDRNIHNFIYNLNVEVGDVWVHTMMAVDVAAERFRTGWGSDLNHDLTVMFGTLCHDFGKPATTQFETGRWRAKGHEEAGIAPTTAFMDRMRAPLDLIKAVNGLVAHHLAPAHFAHPKFNATPKAYRNLARKLGEAGTTLDLLFKVSSSDHFGRTTADAIARDFSIGEKFMAKAKEIQIVDKPEPDVVMGRHLIARGMKPGKEFGPILDKCREYQYETGNKDADEILRVVLG